MPEKVSRIGKHGCPEFNNELLVAPLSIEMFIFPGQGR